MKTAIYSRKSKLTEAGDSIRNQIDMCKDYALLHFGACDFIVYEDEGFSGGNTDRPRFKQMICDAKNHKFQTLICYRLDRISRNVNDFSATLKTLEDNNIAFVSVTERFDTSTPLGKAMLSISSVFAELERDTIAQRITDNFTQLAKTGRYLSGRPPEGFVKKKVVTSVGKSYNVLEIIPEEAKKIELIYQKYLEWESNRRVEIFCMTNGIKTRNGCDIRPDWITRVLTHQLYAVADDRIYDYFESHGYKLAADKEKFDGSHGVTVFRRTKSGHGRHMDRNEPEDIFIGVGSHTGIINSKDWIAVQKIIGGRSAFGIKKPREGKKAVGHYGALNGILRCKCGSYMRPVCIRNGKFYYTCLTKEKSRKRLCDAKNLRHDIDSAVITRLHKDLFSKNILVQYLIAGESKLKKVSDRADELISETEKQINRNKKSTENLIMRLSDIDSTALIKHVEAQIEKLDFRSRELKKELEALQNKKRAVETLPPDNACMAAAVKRIKPLNLDSLNDTLIKRNILKSLVNHTEWSGIAVHICYHFTPSSSDEPTVITLRDIPGDVTEP